MYLPLHQSPLSQYDYKITIIRPSKKSCTAVTQQTLFRGGPLDILGGGAGGQIQKHSYKELDSQQEKKSCKQLGKEKKNSCNFMRNPSETY
jgi:hypothetical protein